MNFFKNVLMSLTYVTLVVYIIYVSKVHKLFAHHQLNRNPIEFWLKYEVIAFFSWIASHALLLFLMFVFKLKSIYKNKHERSNYNLEYIWQSKNASDFLRFHAFESERFSDIVYQILIVLYYYFTGAVVH